ncbi:MAG TPA: ribosomal protein S18-alanine N-acetyltransferase [Actinomycetes bacterium]|nr:ribosomal protein S18-alanine N-acetyltransferase [Actinomycetes bacterium]
MTETGGLVDRTGIADPARRAAAFRRERPDVTFRRMRWWDIPVVVALERELFRPDPWTAEMFWAELAWVPDNRRYLVAEDGAGRLVGYAGLMAVRDEATVQTIGVHPDLHGSGLGHALLHELLEEAKRRGCREVYLEVRADNRPALGLYERFGFTMLGRRRDYYGPGLDALTMRLVIAAASRVRRDR